jgi:hypothetical protein
MSEVPTMRSSFTRILAALVIAFLLAACSGGADLGSIVRQIGGTPAATAAATSTDDATTLAVKDTITRANEAQAKAFNTGDPSLMRATATSDFYTQLVTINRDMASGGVTEIAIVSTDFQSVKVDGANATVVTYETWRSTYNDGSSDETTARNDYTLVLDGSTWRIATDDQPSAVLQPGSPQTQPDTTTPSSAAISSDTSTNWSGYAATGGTFTSVTGTWTVPTVATTTSGADATWVGIGGINSTDLIQAGTEATVSGGEVAYNAWIEMLPAASRPISLSVTPGDSVTVSITQKGTLDWLIELKNNTTGGRYSTTVQYRSSRTSAEWVQEAPSVGRGVVPLDDFGTLKITGASAVRDGASFDLNALSAKAITMINSARQALAVPSVIGADGASFTVTRTQNQSTSGGVPGTGRRRRG